MEQELEQLTQKVADFVRNPASRDADSRFEALALEVFDFQYRHIETYREFCRRKNKTPETVANWRSIPAVPADGFKHFDLFAGDPETAVKVFKSSGTTDPRRASRSFFSQPGLDLMNASIEINAGNNLFPDGRRTRLLILAPSPEIAPHMIMVNGMSHMMGCFGIEGSHFLIGPDGLNPAAIFKELRDCEERGIPVTLMGGSFGFVHLFDAMTAAGLRFALPDGSQLMDAGGYKGRSREISRSHFIEWACSMLGLIPQRVTNLLGMTELASQIYDFIASGDPGDRAKQPPHWMRTELIDPRRVVEGEFVQLTEPGTQGTLRHFDLANIERPMAVHSEDIGVVTRVSSEEPGFEIVGRAKGAEPRGCSLTLEEFTRARVAGQS